MAAEFEIKGLDPLLAKLDSVKQDVKYKGGRFALRKAANLVAAKAKEGAARLDDPATGRRIADNVAVRWNGRRFKSTGDLAFRVGIQHGAKIPKDNKDEGAKGPTPHWRLVELGTEKMRAKPFFRPALENNIQAATNEFVAECSKAIDRAIKKATKT